MSLDLIQTAGATAEDRLRYQAQDRYSAAEHALREFGNTEDIQAAANAVAKIAATAMRRRPAK